MPTLTRISAPGPREGTVRLSTGEILAVPEGWALLPPGDAGLTGRVKKAGATWTVQEKRGNKFFSRGLWAPAEVIESIRQTLLVERADPGYTRKLEAARKKRAVEQEEYAGEFTLEVARFLAFSPAFAELGLELAGAISAHAVPVGSGTVARTERIPIERRAEAAAIAWFRHATTEYDHMKIPREKGARREVRRMLAERTRTLLQRYRRGEAVSAENCLIRKALRSGGA